MPLYSAGLSVREGGWSLISETWAIILYNSPMGEVCVGFYSLSV